ncbi:MAG TPA: response regulator [Acidimicrobiales bacterium]|nr:response regulator [Acidimicrobiales bacterium]
MDPDRQGVPGGTGPMSSSSPGHDAPAPREPLDLRARAARVDSRWQQDRARRARRRARQEMLRSRLLWRDYAGAVYAMADGGGRPLVLVVDDDDDVRMSFAEILRVAGFETIEAPDGSAALQMLAEFPVMAMVLDVRMPVLDGLTLLAQLDAPPPVVLATGHSYNAQVIDHRQKIFAYVQKPVPPDVLITMVGEAVAAAQR